VLGLADGFVLGLVVLGLELGLVLGFVTGFPVDLYPLSVLIPLLSAALFKSDLLLMVAHGNIKGVPSSKIFERMASVPFLLVIFC